MARSTNQKLKLLYLLKFLQRQSDEGHPVTMADMIEELAKHDIPAERKSIYDDLEALRSFGVDVVQLRGKQPGYYIGARDFEVAELKLLVDSIQGSKFITEKKTLALIGKLEGLASVHDARLLERQVYVRNRVKSMNESVYYNVDEIANAINRDRQIRFRYFEFTVEKERQFRRDGAFYLLSPFALMWDDENYYMLAWDESESRLKHFRVDKMNRIQTLEQERQGKDAFQAVDMSAYSKKVFGMFTGQESRVKLRFVNHLAGAVIDRFGKDTVLVRDGEAHFTVSVDVVVSPLFFAWVFGFGTDAEILAPGDVRQKARDAARAIAAIYEP